MTHKITKDATHEQLLYATILERGMYIGLLLMFITFASVVLLEIGLNWLMIFVFGYSLLMLWSVHFTDEILRSAINFMRFKRGKWNIKNL